MRYNGLCKDNNSLAIPFSMADRLQFPGTKSKPSRWCIISGWLRDIAPDTTSFIALEGQGQVVRLALAQHLGEVALGVYVQQQDFLAVHCKTGSQVMDSGTFAYAALLVCYTDYLWFRYFGVSSLP